MVDQYHHGVKIVELTEGPRPIRTVATAVIGIVGTAPDAAVAIAATVALSFVTSNSGIDLVAVAAGTAGNSISLELIDPAANSATLAVSVADKAISASLQTDASGNIISLASEVIAAINGDGAASALLTAADTSGSDGSGVVAAASAVKLTGGENEPFPLNTPSLIIGSRATAARLDASGDGKGTLPAAMDAIFDQVGAMVVVVRVAEDATPATQTSNIIGGTDGNGKNTGLKALLDAEAELGVKPRILGVPGFDAEAAVVAELVSIADSLRGFAYAGINAVTKEDAVTYRDSYGSKRLMLIWPEFTAWDTAASDTVNVSASARALGVRAFIDNQVGWHKTISNVPVNGVTGLSKSVDFNLTDPIPPPIISTKTKSRPLFAVLASVFGVHAPAAPTPCLPLNPPCARVTFSPTLLPRRTSGLLTCP